MIYHIDPPSSPLSGQVELPRSKSISNRLLIIRTLAEESFNIHHLSEADDTRLLQRSLRSDDPVINAAAGGTTFRFLTAYFALQGEQKVITGTERMKERPVGILVDALQELGAEIEYTEYRGYPPVELKGGRLKGGALGVDASVSSQFISALLLIAPLIKNGLCLRLLSAPVSLPYIRMTLALMKQMGVDSEWKENEIRVPEQTYQPREMTVEPDWSAASYFYSMVALSDHSQLLLKDLEWDSIQGDQKIAEWMEPLGAQTSAHEEGLLLSHQYPSGDSLTFDVTDYPDLTPALVVACAGQGNEATFLGLEHLKYKESNRVKALHEELQKVGWGLEEAGGTGRLRLKSDPQLSSPPLFASHNDHRMAMAMSTWACLGNTVGIQQPGVVQKSFPGFWETLKDLGFDIRSEEGE